jgi:uncharacterized protein YggE
MKRFRIALVIAFAASTALAQPVQPVPETVSVSGNGRSTVTPDRFSFNVGVHTVAPTVEEALNENNTRVAAVIAALKKGGATEKEIQTSGFSIFPQQDYQQGQLPRILGYQVQNNINVRRTQIGDAGKLLQVAVNAGVNTSSGLQFEVSDPTKGRDQGLTAAYADARAKAALLAQAAGRTLGRALSISEGTQMVPPRPYPTATRAMAMEARVEQDVPVEAGTQEMSYTVSVIFELK